MITVYGVGTDTIKIEGEINDEFQLDNDERSAYVAFFDGTILSVNYTDEGLWKIDRVQPGILEFSNSEATGLTGGYSDRPTLRQLANRVNQGMIWVVFGPTLGSVKKLIAQTERAFPQGGKSDALTLS